MSTDPALNDYVSGSESGGGIGNTFNFHLYNYSNNNPIRYMDPNGRSSYTIQDGDTLSSIASDYNEKNGTNISYEDLASLNGITDANKIFAGDSLILPQTPRERAAMERSEKRLNEGMKIPNEATNSSIAISKSSVTVQNTLPIEKGIDSSLTFSVVENFIGNLGAESYFFGLGIGNINKEYSDCLLNLNGKLGKISFGIDVLQYFYNPTFDNGMDVSISAIGVYDSCLGILLQTYMNYQRSVNEIFKSKYPSMDIRSNNLLRR